MTKAIEKLKQQEQAAADGLKAKERERADAAAAVTKAEDAYHASSTDSAEKNWLKAKESEALAELRLKTAQRKLSEASIEREAAERAELERESAELRTTLDRPDAEEARLAAKEAGLLLEAAKVRVSRRDNAQARLLLKYRLNEVTRLLTGVEPRVYMHEQDTGPSFVPVAEELQRLARKCGDDQMLIHYVTLMSAGRL